MKRNSLIWWRMAGVSALVLFVAACATVSTVTRRGSHDRGVNIPHPEHAEDLECIDCHVPNETGFDWPDHEVCGMCHDIDLDNIVEEDCAVCHTNEDFEITPRPKSIHADIGFKHAPHVDNEVACTICHADPEKQFLPDGKLKPFCMDCHQKTDEKLLECSVCHTTISKATAPSFRGAVPIPHDKPAIWKKIHGREWRKDEAYCGLCHDDQIFCNDCHRLTEPDSHTVTWRQRTHGIRAEWDRAKCAVCHEEDSCLQCHQNSEPRSHRGLWGGSTNRHCQSCHFPPEQNNCTVCHEEIDHQDTAMQSPHTLGLFPAPCSSCHRTGRPGSAPHTVNGTIACQQCH
jgi:hypothetical protein